jgi:hypothetical protein
MILCYFEIQVSSAGTEVSSRVSQYSDHPFRRVLLQGTKKLEMLGPPLSPSSLASLSSAQVLDHVFLL